MNKKILVKVELIVVMLVIAAVVLFGQDIKDAVTSAISQYIAEQTDMLLQQLIR